MKRAIHKWCNFNKYMLPHVGFAIQPIRTYHNSKAWWNTRPHTQLLTINPSWTSVKETPCEANKTLSPRLSYFTLYISKHTIWDLEDWRVSIHQPKFTPPLLLLNLKMYILQIFQLSLIIFYWLCIEQSSFYPFIQPHPLS